MYNSREIGELRADVAVNCRTLIERAAARGLPVLVVQTVRDAEYQRYLVSMGYAARTATVSAAWWAYGASAGFYYNKAKAENTAGGIVFEAACGRQARSGQDCDGWEENG